MFFVRALDQMEGTLGPVEVVVPELEFVDPADVLQAGRNLLAAAAWLEDALAPATADAQPTAEPIAPPWWLSAPNPPCSPFCDETHHEGEFAGGGGMGCRKTIAKTDYFEVGIAQYHGVDDDGTPGVIEIDPAEVYVHAFSLNDEFLSPQDAAAILPGFAAAVDQAIAQAEVANAAPIPTGDVLGFLAALGRNLRTLRGSTSRRALVEQMNGRGYAWTPSTVRDVEQGRRPLQMAELADLAELFGVRVSALVPQTATDSEVRA
jgi:hypothetical protein